MSPKRNVSFPQLLQIIVHDMHRIRHHPSPAGQDNVEGAEEQQLGQNQSTCTIVELCVKVLPDFRIVK